MTARSTHADAIGLPRRIALPSGAELTVREMNADDADAVAQLYERLSPRDRHRRFFTAYRPGSEFFERLTSVGERGGAGLVVVHRHDPADPSSDSIVAEASYSLLDNGNGEVEVTVDRKWRGWLGAYLLAQLSALAAARGVANLEAEILTENQAMRSLTRARGEVFRDGSDWHTVRVVFSANGAVPSWPRTDRPKVLVEARAVSWDAVNELSGLGYEVLVCRGPEARQRPCPLLERRCCPLARDADAIVVALPATQVRDDLLCAHGTLHAEVPVEVVDGGAGSEALSGAVDRALLRRRERRGTR